MNKNYLLIALFICLSLLSLQGQRFNGGILTGINTSQIDGDRWSGYHQAGFVLGAFVNTDFADKFGGQLEIKYSPKGSATAFRADYVRAIKLRYIDVPVLATYQATEKLKVEAGLSFNYLFSAMYYEDGWFQLSDWDIPPKKFETSLVVGLNYKIFERADANIRYGYSVTPVRSKYSTSTFGQGAWFNNYITLSFYFHIGQ